VFARTTIRTDVGESTDLSVFAIDAIVSTPMIGSFGIFANIGSASGTDNDAVRVGLGQTLAFKAGSLRIFTMAMLAPYQTTGPGGRAIGLVAFTLGPLRSETIGVYGVPAFGKLSEPNLIVVRPDLRMRLWKTFGVYAQYDYNNTQAEKSGLRTGAELAGAF
jgi:hypothetical protein